MAEKILVQDAILLCVFVILFVAMIFPIAVETRASSLDVEVVYDADIDVPETLNITHSQYTPESLIRLIELSSMDEQYWNIYSSYAKMKYNVALRSVSKLILGIIVKTKDVPVNLTIYEEGYAFRNSTFIEGHQTRNHSLEITYTPSNSSSSVRLVDILIRLHDCSWSDFEITNFWIDVVTTEDLFPITFDMRRTNGENLFSNHWLSNIGPDGEPTISLNSTTINPRHVNDTIFIPEGNYSVTTNWANSLITNFSISNTSIVVTWHIKCVRLDFQLTQKVPGLNVDLYGNNFVSFYYKPSLLYSPSLYLAPGKPASIRIEGYYYSAYSEQISVGVNYERGQNQNITFIVKPHLFSIGGVLVTPGRLQILIFSFIIIVGSIFVGRKKLLSNYRILAYLLIFIGMCLPWIQVSKIISTPTMPYGNEYQVTWDIAPALFTSFTSQQNASLVIAPSNQPALFFNPNLHAGLQGGHIVLFLLAIVFLFMIAELFKVPRISALKDYVVVILFLVILVTNLLYNSKGSSIYGGVGYQIGWGSVLIMGTALIWILYTIPSLVRSLSDL